MEQAGAVRVLAGSETNENYSKTYIVLFKLAVRWRCVARSTDDFAIRATLRLQAGGERAVRAIFDART